jgi:hypothetical protein
MRIKASLAAVLAAASVAVGVGVAATPAQSAVPLAVAKTCSAGYVRATLPWGVKCLRVGEFCKVGNPAYLKWGFYCPATGHLRRR